MISALKLVSILMKGNKLGVEMKGLAESSKERLAEALATFISVDTAGALVAMGELARSTEKYIKLLCVVFF